MPPAVGGRASLAPLLARGGAAWRAVDLPAALQRPADLADALAAQLGATGVARVGVAGFSLGGQLALAFAERHPERVAALLLVASGAPDRARGRALARSAPLAALLPTMFLRRRAAASLAPALQVAAPEQRRALEGWLAQASRAELAAPRARLQASDREGAIAPAAFARLCAPVHLLELGADEVIAPAEAARLRALFPQATRETVAGLSHAALLAWPERLLERVATALASLRAGAGSR